jgi:hypothetical protein
MSYFPENVLIVQSARSVLLEVHSPKAKAPREAIAIRQTYQKMRSHPAVSRFE